MASAKQAALAALAALSTSPAPVAPSRASKPIKPSPTSTSPSSPSPEATSNSPVSSATPISSPKYEVPAPATRYRGTSAPRIASLWIPPASPGGASPTAAAVAAKTPPPALSPAAPPAAAPAPAPPTALVPDTVVSVPVASAPRSPRLTSTHLTSPRSPRSARIAAAAPAPIADAEPVAAPIGFPDEAAPVLTRARVQLVDQHPPLHRLVETGNVAAVDEELRRFPACIRERSKLGWTALHAAAHVDASPAMVARLLAAGLDLEDVDSSGNTPLFIAAGHNRVGALETLLTHGAVADRRNARDRTLLQEALFLEADRTFAWVLARSGPAAPRAPGGEALNALGPAWWRTTLLLAIGESVDVPTYVAPLLAAGADPLLATAETNQTALQYAVVCDNVAAARALVHAHPALVNQPLPAIWATTALNLAVAEHKSAALVRALLDAGADAGLTDNVGHTAVELAIVHAEPTGRLLQTLLAHPASAALGGRTSTAGWWRAPVHLAARQDLPIHLRLLAQAGAPLNVEDAQGRTPLVIALVETCPAAFAALRALPQVDVNYASTKPWRYAAHAAIAYGSVALLPELLRTCPAVDWTARDATDRTAAEFAVAQNNAEVVRLLVPAVVAPTAIAAAQPWRTLLHVAVLYNRPEMVRLLLDLGADPRLTNAAGLTPLLLAQRLSLDACTDALNDHVAVKAAAARTSTGGSGWGIDTGAVRGSFERARSSFERTVAAVRASFDKAVRTTSVN